jgi:hypothetical protein
MADLRDKVRPEILLETPLDERGLFALARVEPSPAELPAPATGPAKIARLGGRLAFLPVLSADRLPSAFRCAVLTEWERGTAFLVAPVLMAAGALTYFAVGREPYLATTVACVAAAATLTFLARARLVLHLAFAALLCFTLGMLFAKVETVRAGTKVMGGEISTRLTGRVAVIEHQANGRIRMTIDVIGTERPTLKYVPQRVRVSARTSPKGSRPVM